MRRSSRSSGSTFSLLRLYYKVETFEPELREYVFFTTAVLHSCEFRAGAPGLRFLYYGCTTKLRLSSRSSGSTFSLLRLYYKVATFEPELREYVFFTTAVLQSCDVRAGAPGVRFLYYGCTTKLRRSSRSSGSTFSLLRLYYKVASFEPELQDYVFSTTAVLQSCVFRAGAPGVRFLYYGCTTKLRRSSRSSGSTFSLLRLYYKVATFEPELREYVFFTTVVPQSCVFRAGAPGVRFLYYGCTTKLRRSSRSSGSTFSLLRLYYKVATFEPELREYVFFTTAVLQSCDVRAGAPGVRFLYYGCATKLRLSSRSSGSTFSLLRLCHKVASFKPELREYVFSTTAVLQSCVFRAGAPGVLFLYYGCATKLRVSSRSSGSTFSLLRLYYKVASFEPELREYVFFTTVVPQSCEFQAGAPGVRFLYYGCTTKLRLSSRSSGSRVLRKRTCRGPLNAKTGFLSGDALSIGQGGGGTI